MEKNKSQNQNVGERLNTAVDDVKSGYKDIEEKSIKAVSNAKDGVVTWVEDGVSNIKEGTHQLMDDAKEAYDKTAQSIDKNVQKGLTQYNTKAQEVADKVPGGFGDKVIRYPWVAITIATLFGFVLGIFIKPCRHSLSDE